MPKNDLNVTLKGIDELLFSTEEQRQEEKREQVQQIPIDELHPFRSTCHARSYPHVSVDTTKTCRSRFHGIPQREKYSHDI